jgi:hypothetical protein
MLEERRLKNKSKYKKKKNKYKKRGFHLLRKTNESSKSKEESNATPFEVTKSIKKRGRPRKYFDENGEE